MMVEHRSGGRGPLVSHRAFAHPVWVGSLLLLLVNDHLLKGAGVLPGWMTGKLSDFAGLFMAPALLGAALFVRTRGGFAAVHVGLGLFFAALKLCPPAARAYEALTALGPMPGHIVVDPTDLIALPALWASWRLLTPLAEAGAGLGRMARGSALLMASFGCVATSAPEREGPNPEFNNPRSPGATFPPVQGSLGLANDTGGPLVVRVRYPRPSVEVDCDVVAASPASFFDAALFDPAETWLLQDGRLLPLRLPEASAQSGWTKTCQVAQVDGDALRPTVIFWRTSQFPDRTLDSFLGRADGQPTTIRMTNQGARVVLAEHPAVAGSPSTLAPTPSEACAVAPPTEAVDWSEPMAVGTQTLAAITPSPDGCVALDLPKKRVYLCGVPEALPFAVGDELRFETSTRVGGRTLTVSTPDGRRLLLGRGADLSALGEVGAEAEPAEGCAGVRVECGGMARPLVLRLADQDEPLRIGQTAALPGGKIKLVRAQRMPIFDGECSSATDPKANYLEWGAVFGGLTP